MTDFDRLRLGMVDGQIRTADVTDHRVLAAFLSTPREAFTPEARRSLAYLDARTPLGPAGRAMLDPMTLARLIQLAAPDAEERALVVGCGLGYTAAILAELVRHVTALESDPDLAAGARERLAGRPNVSVVEGPLPDGAAGEAPFDLIFCDGAVAANLSQLARQLEAHGRIVAIAGEGGAAKAVIYRRAAGGLAQASAFDASGPLLPGFEPAAAFAF
jgi:protein-L-isoaspartate(D-aspartate) O-methyltransferase